MNVFNPSLHEVVTLTR